MNSFKGKKLKAKRCKYASFSCPDWIGACYHNKCNHLKEQSNQWELGRREWRNQIDWIRRYKERIINAN